MSKSATYKDIGAALNVSVVTVHKAVHNKSGISEATRKRVNDYIEKNNYKINKAASMLKRSKIKLAAILVEDIGENKHFAMNINSGIKKAIAELEDFNVEVTEYYTKLDVESQMEVLEELLKAENSVSGVLINPTDETMLNDMINRLIEDGIYVVTLNNDAPESKRTANVSADNTMSGEVAAELMVKFLGEKKGQIIIHGGSRRQRNHQENVNGFTERLCELRSDLDYTEYYEFDDVEKITQKLEKYFATFDDIVGVYCNNTRGTIAIAKSLARLDVCKKITFVGSDVCVDMLPYFENGIIDATTFQYPKEQGYKAMMNLYSIVTNEYMSDPVTKISIGISIAANAKNYSMEV